MLSQNAFAEADISIQQGDNNFNLPLTVGIPDQSNLSFSASGVPQSTNIFQMTFYPHDVVQSTKLNESSFLNESASSGQDDSTMLSSDILTQVQARPTGTEQKEEHLRNLEQFVFVFISFPISFTTFRNTLQCYYYMLQCYITCYNVIAYISTRLPLLL